MVEDLINADADINAADNSGKTALHWAAAVNNVDAVNVLLVHGANRDAQDDKVCNRLFCWEFSHFLHLYFRVMVFKQCFSFSVMVKSSIFQLFFRLRIILKSTH